MDATSTWFAALVFMAFPIDTRFVLYSPRRKRGQFTFYPKIEGKGDSLLFHQISEQKGTVYFLTDIGFRRASNLVCARVEKRTYGAPGLNHSFAQRCSSFGSKTAHCDYL